MQPVNEQPNNRTIAMTATAPKKAESYGPLDTFTYIPPEGPDESAPFHRCLVLRKKVTPCTTTPPATPE